MEHEAPRDINLRTAERLLQEAIGILDQHHCSIAAVHIASALDQLSQDRGRGHQEAMSLNDNISVELTPENVFHTRVVWTNGNECGVAFERHVDCANLLMQYSKTKWRQRPRSQISPQILATDAVSRRGGTATYRGNFRPGLPVKVIMPNGQDRKALVQWAKDNFARFLLTDSCPVVNDPHLDELSSGRL